MASRRLEQVKGKLPHLSAWFRREMATLLAAMARASFPLVSLQMSSIADFSLLPVETKFTFQPGSLIGQTGGRVARADDARSTVDSIYGIFDGEGGRI